MINQTMCRGKLDMDHMYDIIEHKGNIYTDILTVREALLS